MINEQQHKRLKENQDYINQFIDGVEFEVYTEWRDLDHDRCCWGDITSIADFSEYDKADIRIKKTKPFIDWSHVDDEYIFMATHANGYSQIFRKKPFIKEGNAFWSSNMDPIAARCFSSYKPGKCDWFNSLVKRPDGS